jgi:hypothetical protein
MSRDTRSLLVLTLFCTLAAAFFGFGTIAFSFQSAYNGSGREPLFFLAREIVYLVIAVVLVMWGGWRGVLASVSMTVGATTIEWPLPGSLYLGRNRRPCRLRRKVPQPRAPLLHGLGHAGRGWLRRRLRPRPGAAAHGPR